MRNIFPDFVYIPSAFSLIGLPALTSSFLSFVLPSFSSSHLSQKLLRGQILSVFLRCRNICQRNNYYTSTCPRWKTKGLSEPFSLTFLSIFFSPTPRKKHQLFYPRGKVFFELFTHKSPNMGFLADRHGLCYHFEISGAFAVEVIMLLLLRLHCNFCYYYNNYYRLLL